MAKWGVGRPLSVRIMVRPRKIPKDFIPRELSDSSEDEPYQVPINPVNYVPINPFNYGPIPSNSSNNSSEEQFDEYIEAESDGNITDSDADEEAIETDSPFHSILQALAKEWLVIEMGHHVSKRASDLFWKIAKKLFHLLMSHKTTPNCKVPSFTHLRRRLIGKYCPDVTINVAYKNTEND